MNGKRGVSTAIGVVLFYMEEGEFERTVDGADMVLLVFYQIAKVGVLGKNS